jgi:hypothetical protein
MSWKKKKVHPGFPRSGRGGKTWNPRTRYISSGPTVHFDLGLRRVLRFVAAVALVVALLVLFKTHA